MSYIKSGRGIIVFNSVVRFFFSAAVFILCISGVDFKFAPGVVVELNFSEGSGTSTADVSGNSHHATLVNGAAWIAGRYGQGISFDGSNDYASLADHANFTLDPAQSYTWSAWIRNTNFNQWGTIWSQTVSTSSFFYFYSHSTTDADGGPVTNGISVYWWGNNGANRLALHSNNNVMTAGQWSYVTITYNGSLAQANRFTIYVNAVDVTNRSDVSSAGTLAAINPTNTRIGANQPYGEYFNGGIDEFRYYRRLLSLSEIQSDMNAGTVPDTQAPAASITAPTGGNVSGTINVTANASDNVGVTGVQFMLDGVNLGSEDLTAPYSVSWNTTSISNGNHNLTARARDAAGNSTTSSAVAVNVSNFVDTEAPSVAITSPTGGNVSGTINVNANAADNVGVTGVQFFLDGVSLGAEDLSAPYSVSWNTTTIANGNHSLTARARDAVGNSSTSSSIIVNVNNFVDTEAPSVAVTAPTGGDVNGTISVNAGASDNVGVVGVQFFLDGATLGAEDLSAPYSVSWNTSSVSNGPHTLTARARDAAGNSAPSNSVNINVNNFVDTEPPIVSISGPTVGTVAGTINVSATASDNVSVVGVQFLLNGNNLGTEDLSNPYSVSWNTTSVANGNYTLSARARDAAGNLGAATNVVVNVFNNNLVAAFGFNENTGTTANDNSGNGNHGSLINGTGWSGSGRFGAAALFDGTNDLVSIADANSLDLTNGMTIEAWVNPSNVTGYKTILCKQNGTNNLSYALSANNGASNVNNQRPNTRIRIGTTTTTTNGTSKLPLNTWTHLACTYDGAVLRLYVNGTQVSSVNVTGNMVASTNLLHVGGAPQLATQYFAGRIDELRIYNRSLTQAEIQSDMNTPVAPDLTGPTVNITTPLGGTVSGTVAVSANASDNIAVTGVQFQLNGSNLGAEDLSSPYSVSWSTTPLSNGTYTLTAIARDASGNTAVSSGIVVNVDNDKEAPVASITSPTGGTVNAIINVNADASDNVGVVGVQFLLNGTNLGAEDLSAPYSVSWNTASVTDGNYQLTARTRDAAGNSSTSATVNVSVLNNPPDTEFPTVAMTAPSGGEISGTVNLTAIASDNVGVAGVQFLLNGVNLGSEDLSAPYSTSWNTTSVTNGDYILTARARDAAGNSTVSSAIAVTVNNIPDTDPPSVNITSPSAGTVTGTINVTANASDNSEVAGVQFLLNGVSLGAEDVTPPYSASWNTTTVANGGYILTARARDASGNSSTSASVNVTVSNVSNLIAALSLNEGTGTSAADISGNNHHGVLTGGPVWNATGRFGTAINFDGSNDYVNIADHNNFTLNPAQNYTWSAWVRNNNFNEWSTVWSQTLDVGNFFYFYAHTTASTDGGGGPVTNGVSAYWVTSAGRVALHSNNNVLTLGQWNHITVTYNASLAQSSRLTIYVNGADVTNRTAVGSSGTLGTLNPTNIRIGSNQAFGEFLNGTIDEVRFYNRLLTPAEIVSDMNTAVGIDNVSPSIAISAPANGSNLSGAVTVNANAADNVAVAGVQFYIDGLPLGAEDVAAPYSVSWNTQAESNGSHTITARARDAAGNSTTSVAVNVNVVPDFILTVTTPNKNVEVSGTTDFRMFVEYVNGFTSSNVSLQVSGLPANATGHFLLNPMSHQGETQLIVTTNNAAVGTYIVTISATAEGVTHSQQATLNVTGAADFSLAVSPAIQNVTRGNSVTFTINLYETNDFTSPVTLSVVGLPANTTASFSPPAPVPAALSVLTITTTASTPTGTFNLTVQGVSGALTRTIPITVSVTAAQSVWNVSVIGSTGVPNNTVRVGHLKDDGLERIYVGTIATGRMLEYAWNGSGWDGPVDVGGSPSGQEIHNCTIGPGRGDGKERMYIASYDFNIYEIWHDATGWHQLTVGNLNGNLGMHTVVGVGRNDGVVRLYAASTHQLFEFTWNGTSWTKVLIGSTPGAHELALGNGRRDGLNNIYIASISSGNFEAHWTGTAWQIASMGDNGDARGLELGDGRNDGIIRVYSALFDGRVREFTWNGSAWTFVNMPIAGTQNVHAYIVPGRNDGINRVYANNANGKAFEYTWNGSGWDIYNMGGGSDYLYGMHYGTGRNDGLIRFYGADRGSVNRVYEFTWTAPNPLVYLNRKNAYSIRRRLY